MNVIQISNFDARFTRASGKNTLVRRALTAPASTGFSVQIEDALTEIVFVAAALCVAALLRYGAPFFPGHDVAANVIDFGAACGGLHALVNMAKISLLAVFRRS
jgi:hypothetical protein